MKRSWLVAGVAVAVLMGTVAVAQARGPAGMMMGGGGRGMMMGGSSGSQGMMMGGGGRGMMMGGGAGHGMMMGGGGGHGMMMGGGAMPCQGAGAEFDPAAAATHAESMLGRHEAMIAQLESQLAAATDEAVKARLTTQIERQKLMLGAMEVHAGVLKSQPATREEAALATARGEVEYWSKATATDPVNQAWITLRAAEAKRLLDTLVPKS